MERIVSLTLVTLVTLVMLVVVGCGGATDGHTSTQPLHPEASGPEPALDPRGIIERAGNRFAITGSTFVRVAPGHEARIEGGRLSFEPARGDRGCASETGARRAAPLFLRTVRVAREADILEVARPATREESGGVAIDHGPVIERFQPIPRGIRQSWEFPSRPPGHGDIKVEVDAWGEDHVGGSEFGLHFTDPATGLGTTYGHGMWIDAMGERNSVPAVYDRGRIVLSVPAAVADRSAYPAVLDPDVVSDYDRAYANADVEPGDQIDPAMASDYREGTSPSVMLIAWTDHKCGEFPDVKAMRVDGDGDFIDEVPLPISHAANKDELTPAIAYSKAHDQFLVVYEKEDPDAGIYLRHVDVDAAADNILYDVLGQDYRCSPLGSEVKVRNQGAKEHHPDISCAYDVDGDCHVVWSTNDTSAGTWKIESATVSHAGGVVEWSVVGGTLVDVSSGISGTHKYPRVAAHDSDSYLVVWFDESWDVIRLADIDAGSRTSHDLVHPSTWTALPAADIETVNSDDGGDLALVVWRHNNGNLKAVRLDSDDGSQVGSISTLTSGGTDYTPTIAYDPTGNNNNNEWIVQWWREGTGAMGDPDGYYRSIITAAGAVGAATNVSTDSWDDTPWDVAPNPSGGSTYGESTPPAGGPILDGNGDTQHVLVAPIEASDYDVRLRTYDPQTLTASTDTLSRLVTWQTVPGVAQGGSYYLLAWGDEEGEDNTVSQVWASRVEITSVGGQSYQTFDDGLNTGSRIRVDGSAGDTAFAPSVGWDGANFLVAWVDLRDPAGDQIRGRFYTPGNPGVWTADSLIRSEGNGDITTTTFEGLTGFGGPPSIACASGDTPNECLIAYVLHPAGGNPRIVTQIYDKDGWINGVNTGNSVGQREEVAIAPGGEEVRHPEVAWAGDRWAVVWTRHVLAANLSDIKGAWLNRDGSAVIGTFNVSTANDLWRDERPTVASYSTADVVVAWHRMQPSSMAPYWQVVDSNCTAAGGCGGTTSVAAALGGDFLSPWIEAEHSGQTCAFSGYRVSYIDTYNASDGAILTKVMALTTTGATGATSDAPCNVAMSELTVRNYPYSSDGEQRFQRPVLAVPSGGLTGLLFHDAPLEATCRTRVVSSSLLLDP